MQLEKGLLISNLCILLAKNVIPFYMLSEYAVFAHCIEAQNMPHWGFVMFSVLLPPMKAKKGWLLNSLHLASAPRINQSSLKLIINYSWLLMTPGESARSKGNKKQFSHSFFSFLWLILSLGITVTCALLVSIFWEDPRPTE